MEQQSEYFYTDLDNQFEDDLSLFSNELHNIQLTKNYHILINENKLNFDNKCKSCCQLFSPSIFRESISSDPSITIYRISHLEDLNFEIEDIQCLVIQLQKARDALKHKLQIICYDLQINQQGIEKVFKKYSISLPFTPNEDVKQIIKGQFEENMYIAQKYKKTNYLLYQFYECSEHIHNILQNIQNNKQMYYKFNQVIFDKSLKREQKLQELTQLKTQILKKQDLPNNSIANDFPQLELECLQQQILTQDNRSKIIKKAYQVYEQYPNISCLSSVINFKLYNGNRQYQPEYISADSIDNLIQKGVQIYQSCPRFRILRVNNLYAQRKFDKVIDLLNDVIANEDPCDLYSHTTLFLTYFNLKDEGMAIHHLRQVYLDNSNYSINLFNLIQKLNTIQHISIHVSIQKDVIYFILFRIAYSKLALQHCLFMSGIQHWDLFLD